MRFSRAAGREDPIGRLLCEFEVGLSLKNARGPAKTKPLLIRKKLPVQAMRDADTTLLIVVSGTFFQELRCPSRLRELCDTWHPDNSACVLRRKLH